MNEQLSVAIQEQKVWQNALHENQPGAEGRTCINPTVDKSTQITNKSSFNVLGYD